MERPRYIAQIEASFEVHPVVALLGPRQCGKSYLAKAYGQQSLTPRENYFDLEDSEDLQRLAHPKQMLTHLSGLIIIDEIQRMPDLFPLLRVLVDNANNNIKILILGSASRELIKQSSETLAGRIEYIELSPFACFEVDNNKILWERGGFPLAYLAENEPNCARWRTAFIRTFLEQDIPNLGFRIPPANIHRFWMMLTHYHAQLFKASEIAHSLQISAKTVSHYLDILSGTLMVRILTPWHENIAKRQVKSPKIYFRDSGIFHQLLGINNRSDLLTHPKLGSSWEGFALENVIRHYQSIRPIQVYFWSTYQGAELDLLIFDGTKRLGFEFKYADAPKTTKSMHQAIADLKLDQLTVIYPGEKSYTLADKIFVKPLSAEIGRHG